MATRLVCQTHPGQPLNMVCLSTKCTNRGLLCYLCQVQSHPKHAPLASLKIFLHSFLASTPNNESFVLQSAQIDEELLLISRKLLKLKPQIPNYSVAQQTFGKFWKETVEQVAEYDCILAELQQILQPASDQKQLNAWIAKHCDLFDPDKEERDKDSVYVAYLKAELASLQAITAALQKLQQKPQFQQADVLALFRRGARTTRLKLFFSETLKGTCMSIHSPTKASMQTSGNQRMMLLQPALSTSRGEKKWKVKIQKLASWIGVGVSHLDSVKGVNFDFSYTNANHGNYLISSNGYSWNGYKMEFNSKFEPFQFTTADVIQVSYDPANNKITFKKENHQQTFTYDIDPNQKPIHAAINMTGIGDTVEILQ